MAQDAAAPQNPLAVAGTAVLPSLPLLDFTRTEAAGSLLLNAPADGGASTTLKPPGQSWDVSDYTRLELEVANAGAQALQIRVRALNEGGSDWGNSAINEGFIAARTRKVFNVFLYRPYELREKFPDLKPFVGMSGLPGGLMSHWHTIDAGDVRSLQIEVLASAQPQQLQVFRVTATHPIVPAILQQKGADFFPFVDRFGQYKYLEWPGKVHSEAELVQNAASEARDLAAHAPPEWDRFGGWKNGPRLEATGSFRTLKREGKWWLVDPDGLLFWSHGPNSVGIESAGTRVTGREKFFDALPPRSGITQDAWLQGKKEGSPLDVNFLSWNMARQYGASWQGRNPDLTHRRLRSWGMNTIGNWSNSEIQEQNRTPFTASLWPWSPTLAGDTAWDVFHPDFKANFESGIKGGVEKYARDPWCIGYFIHNEMGWPGSALGFMQSVLAAAPEAHTKREFLKYLQQKTPAIADFNRKTERSFADWDALLASRDSFDLAGVKQDAEAFYERYCDRYFQTCAEALHKFAPGKLYLGARMHVSNPISVRSSARFCDVLSFNLYRSDISGFRPGGEDKPVIASEFHFGALDRGMFGTGLQPASDEQDRADKYRFYVNGALKNPYVVGAHWFAYSTQAVTGRGDGENYEDGLFDITNNPYPELRAALRDVGYKMYETRSRP